MNIKLNRKQIITYITVALLLLVITGIGFIYRTKALELLSSPWGWGIIALWSFTESSFFPIPPDPGIALMATQHNWLIVALFATFWSVVGSLFGHFIGQKYGHGLAEKFFGKEKVDKVEKIFNDWSGISLLIAAITPIPFKVFTILSGVMEVSRKELIIYSTIGRGFRFILVAYIISETANNSFIKNNLEVIFIVTGLIILVGGILWVMLVKKRKQ